MPSDNPHGIVRPGSTPTWPATVDAGNLSEGDRSSLSEAAWARSNGSMQAYEQFLREHRTGAIDLLSGPQASGGQDLASGRVTSEAGTGSNTTETGTSGPSLAEQREANLTADEQRRLSELEAKADRNPDEATELEQLRTKASGG